MSPIKIETNWFDIITSDWMLISLIGSLALVCAVWIVVRRKRIKNPVV